MAWEKQKQAALWSIVSPFPILFLGTNTLQKWQVEPSASVRQCFLFKIGTAQLIDVSQKANLDELARVAKAYHLKISVVGAADSATGNDGINNPLSKSRADYITQQLMVRGIDKSMIISKARAVLISIHQLQSTVIRLSDYLHSKCVLLSVISKTMIIKRKESVREEWALSAIGCFVLSPVAISCL